MLRTVARGSSPSVDPRASPTAPPVTAPAHLGRCPLQTSCGRPTWGVELLMRWLVVGGSDGLEARVLGSPHGLVDLLDRVVDGDLGEALVLGGDGDGDGHGGRDGAQVLDRGQQR